jgi:hypothetical protein
MCGVRISEGFVSVLQTSACAAGDHRHVETALPDRLSGVRDTTARVKTCALAQAALRSGRPEKWLRIPEQG